MAKRDKLISTAIAADLLGFSQDYIRRLCVEGKIKAEKLARDWVFRTSDIEHLIKKRKGKADEEV